MGWKDIFDVYQIIFIIGMAIFLILRLIVYLFLKSIGEKREDKFLRGTYTRDDLERWKNKVNTRKSEILYRIVERVRNFGIVIAIVFFIIPLTIKIILLLLGKS